MDDGDKFIGDVLGGRYQLREVIAGGAQGHLYRAKDLKDGEDVAIKVLRNSVKDPNALERFFREGRALMELSGTAAVRVLDQTSLGDGTVCLVMELLRGRELQEQLVELEQAGERMPIPEMLEIFAPIVKTLDCARELGIVHRDIKPENIFVIHPAYGGGVRLLDFGFVRFIRNIRITNDGMVAGSPNHIAPEVWMGMTDVDHRADVYALGVVLFRVLGGRVPFMSGGSAVDLMRVVTTAERPSLCALRPDLPRSIDDWVVHALAADRDRRFSRTSALWNALKTCLPK
jgi:serine/threonine-protein kinase